MADLAAAAGLSRAHFSRMFTKTFGESPRAYLQSRRLERAAALLRYTDRSVAEICVMVGLQSIGSFTTSFARVFGKPPAAYRASMPPASVHARVPSCIRGGRIGKSPTQTPSPHRARAQRVGGFGVGVLEHLATQEKLMNVWAQNGNGKKVGHVMLIVGYNDAYTTTTGAVRVQNSFGTGWGDNGFVWIAYNALESMAQGRGVYVPASA